MGLLSYAIQNFYHVNQSLPITQKAVLAWTFRNIHLIVAFMKINTNTFFKIGIYSTSNSFIIESLHVFFNAGLYKIFKRLLYKWKPLLGSNYTQSLEYWTFKLGIASLEHETTSVSLLPTNKTYFFNQYFTSVVVLSNCTHEVFTITPS
jgi:hypothetical protein